MIFDLKGYIMSFFTVSHWEAKTWNKEDEAKASEKYIPMILSFGATSLKCARRMN